MSQCEVSTNDERCPNKATFQIVTDDDQHGETVADLCGPCLPTWVRIFSVNHKWAKVRTIK